MLLSTAVGKCRRRENQDYKTGTYQDGEKGRVCAPLSPDHEEHALVS